MIRLILILLYFVVGWIVTEVYELDNDIWKLLIFIGWPILIGGFLVIFILLFLFGVVLMIEEIFYTISHKQNKQQ